MAIGLHAQTTIKGTVKDGTGEGVIGATVMDKANQKNATITDLDGNFTLTVTGKEIVVSYVGMKTQTINVAGKTQVDVLMEDDNATLNEVVVIGYGTVRKKDLTGSVATVKGSDLVQIPVTNTAEALTGKLPGVQITTTDGSPDAEMIIKVRGGGSITGDNSPLYIVDGFPVSSISDISPADIEDITVLKDASSTAIYGSQGANGVILIQTKGAKAGKTQISYNGYIQGKSMAKKLHTMTPSQYAYSLYEYNALQSGGINKYEKRMGSYDDIDLYKYQKGTDWQDEMFGESGLSTSHNISISGGSEKTQFSLSGTYAVDNSLMEDNGYSRYNMNFKLKHELFKNVTLDFGMRLSDSETKGVGSTGGKYKIRSYETVTKGPVNGLYDQWDVDPSTLSEEEYDEYISVTRSLKDKVNDYWRRKNDRRYNYSVGLTWKINKMFTYRAEYGYDYNFFQQKDWYGALSNKSVQDGNSLPMGEWTKKDSWKRRLSHNLTWKKNFNKTHDFNVMIGQEYIASGSETMGIVGKYFSEETQPKKMFATMADNGKTQGAQTISSSLGQEDRLLSYFGRLNYTLLDRYLLTFTMRADGSSKFAKGNKWGYFPAMALAWRVVEEPWMESTHNWLSNLKFRLSFGTAGNNRIGSSMFVTEYKPYSSSKYYGAGNTQNGHYTLANSQLANKNLKWETTITRNVGLDFGFFKERLSGSVDFYYNSVKNLLIDLPVTAIGYTSMMRNLGETSNKGVEVTLNGVILQNKDYSRCVWSG